MSWSENGRRNNNAAFPGYRIDRNHNTRECFGIAVFYTVLPVGNPNRTHFTGKIPVYTNETSLIVPPSTISLRFARLSS